MSHSKNILFDELCIKTKCSYMSDLTSLSMRPAIAQAVQQLDINDFEDIEWIKAAEYVAVNKVHFENAKAAREYLLKLR